MLPSFSSDSSSITSQEKYDVFISFRGPDTRRNFTSHLYAALCRKKIRTFIDDEELRTGNEIEPSLLTAIQESKVSVIVFSKDYASSGWCLKELVKIIDCKNTMGQIVIPVFHSIDPSDVRYQTGTFEEAFRMHEEIFKRSLDELQGWKNALREAANLCGYHSTVHRHESAVIEEIAKDVLKRLYDISSGCYNDLVGADSRIKEIKSLLCTTSVGIWGIGGIGKTTLSEAVFGQICSRFEVSYFMHSVRERSEASGGLIDMKQKLFSAILKDVNLDMGTLYTTVTKERLRRTQVFIVFDDVTDFTQIEYLIGGLHVFDSKSRFIITSRVKQVLKNCGLDYIHEVQGLLDGEDLQFFSGYAFKLHSPKLDYMELSKRVAIYAKGLPLALKLLGSSLFEKEKDVWENTLEKLERFPVEGVQKVLEISFEGLDADEENIFLDIACFFTLTNKDFVIKFLNACDFYTKRGLSTLVDKSLITISSDHITMHDLVREMGREIARRTRSRLYHEKDIFDVLIRNTGTTSIEGISFDMSKMGEIHLNPRAFANMVNLRYLNFHKPWYTENTIEADPLQVLEFDSIALRYFHWSEYPMISLPSNFCAINLVELHMRGSQIQQLWNGVQNLVKLETIDLGDSRHLGVLPDLSRAKNLKYLYLGGCESLVEIPSSIQYLNKLVTLDLSDCKSLIRLPPLVHLESLIELDLKCCSMLKMCPKFACSVKRLCLLETAVEALPSSIMYLSSQIDMDLSKCKSLRSLSSSIGEMKSLQKLDLSGCTELERLPKEIGDLEALEILKAEGTAIREVPSSIVQLHNLKLLSFKSCKGLILPPNLSGLCCLTNLDLTNCGLMELPDDLGQLSSLRELYLGLNNFESLPTSIMNLSKLVELDLSNCKRLVSLPKLSFIRTFIEEPSVSDNEYPTRWEFKFINCFKLDRNALEDIMEDILQILQLVEYDEIQRYEFAYQSRALICFPGREICNWFSIQSTESFISLELPQNCDHEHVVGFATCIVVDTSSNFDYIECPEGFPVLEIVCDYEFIQEDDCNSEGSYHEWIELVPYGDHVVVGYYTPKLGRVYNEAYFDFHVSCHVDDDPHKFNEYMRVKMCGVELIYSPGSQLEKPVEV